MHHPFAVGEMQRFGDSAHDGCHDRWSERALSFQHALEGVALDVLHHDEHQSGALLDGINRDDARVIELGGRARFDHEAVGNPLHVEQIGEHDLDGHGPVKRDVERKKHGRHPAAADLAFNDVLIRCCGPNALKQHLRANAHQAPQWSRTVRP